MLGGVWRDVKNNGQVNGIILLIKTRGRISQDPTNLFFLTVRVLLLLV